MISRTTQPVTDHPLVQPEPPVNDLRLAYVEADQDEYHVDRCQNPEDTDGLPECGCVELLHGGQHVVALVGKEDIEPDGDHRKQQQ